MYVDLKKKKSGGDGGNYDPVKIHKEYSISKANDIFLLDVM